jgi:hypothetical protein
LLRSQVRFYLAVWLRHLYSSSWIIWLVLNGSRPVMWNVIPYWHWNDMLEMGMEVHFCLLKYKHPCLYDSNFLQVIIIWENGECTINLKLFYTNNQSQFGNATKHHVTACYFKTVKDDLAKWRVVIGCQCKRTLH